MGEYCTSPDMAGASLALIKLDNDIESLLMDPDVPIRKCTTAGLATFRGGPRRSCCIRIPQRY